MNGMEFKLEGANSNNFIRSVSSMFAMSIDILHQILHLALHICLYASGPCLCWLAANRVAVYWIVIDIFMHTTYDQEHEIAIFIVT